MIWGRLFEYLEKHECYNDHSFTRTFCKENEINFDELYPLLKDTGGCCCDCEVLLNTGMNVDHNSEIPLIKNKVSKFARN